jgi:hypothetical protein
MIKQTRFQGPLGATALAGCLALALSSVFAAESPFPIGAYAVEGHKVRLTFNDKAEFRVTEGGVTQVVGRYKVEQDRLELTDLQGPWACTKAGQQTGTYRWNYANSVLTFSKVTDLCEDRVQSLTPANWARQH